MRRLLAAVTCLLCLSGTAAYTYVGEKHKNGSVDAMKIIVPGGVEAHDALVAVIAAPAGAEVSPPGGWEPLGSLDGLSVRLVAYHRVAAEGEPGDHTFTVAPKSDAAGAILAYRDVAALAWGPSGLGPDAVSLPDPQHEGLVVGAFAVANKDRFDPDPADLSVRWEGNAGDVSLLVGDADSVGPGAATAKKPGETMGVLLLGEPVRVSFTGAASSAYEWETPTIPLELNAARSQDVTVDVLVAGTADGSDATVASTITIPAGTTTAEFPVTLVDDSVPEGDESLVLTLSAPEGALPGGTTQHTLTILDDDPRVVAAAAPVTAAGEPMPGASWGGWTATPGAVDVTATNYLALTCRGPPETPYTVMFTESFTAGPASIPLVDNVALAAWEDVTGTAMPADGTYEFGEADGSHEGTCGPGSRVYVTYRIAVVPDPAPDADYQAPVVVA